MKGWIQDKLFDLAKLFLVLSLILVSTVSCQKLRTVKVTVTEDNGTPIKGAEVTVTFLGYNGDQTTREVMLSNSKGQVEASGKPKLRMHVRIEKEGYYRTSSGRLSRTRNHDVKFVLRKIKNPIPLYAKKVHLQVPVNRKWVEYDLKVGDWLEPYGNGQVPDFMVRCDTTMISEVEGAGSVEIKFNEYEGIIKKQKLYLKNSQMKMPHMAPHTGYLSLLSLNDDPSKNVEFKTQVGFFIRTRVTMLGEEVTTAHYGKISGIGFDPRGSRWYEENEDLKSFATLSLTYYFNPTPNDRNLEFDPKRNLFKDLDVTEMVREP